MNMPAFDMHPFFEMTPDLVCIAGKDGFFRKVNYAVINKLEYTEEELFSKLISEFIHPEDKELTAAERKKLLNGNPLLNFQNRYITKSGKVIWLNWTSIYFAENEVVFAIAKDVTEKKLIELEIQEKYAKFKNLAKHFKSSIEKDKKHLAGELHEEIAQLAVVVKMDLNWMNSNMPNLSGPSKDRLEHALTVTDLLINAVQRISFSISPNMLEELGLNETLKWLCNEFTLLSGISCRLENAYEEKYLTHEIKLDFFRICQEALRNVMYHAQAGEVKISIEDIGENISLCIIDDGKGFEVEMQQQTSGLAGMRERTASINGRLTIESEIGKGTKISVVIARPSAYTN